MILFQVGFSSSLVLTYMIAYAYYTLVSPILEPDRTIFLLVAAVTVHLHHMNYAKSFYICTLSSQLFRSIFVARVKFGMRKVLGRYHPTIFSDTRVSNFERTGGSRTRPNGQHD